MKAPQDGGYYFSGFVLARCRAAFRPLREPDNVARKAAQTELRARCDMSESELAQRDADLFAARLRDGAADPISNAMDAVQAASTPAERRAAMAALLAMPLPMPALLLSALPQKEDLGYYFHGTYYKGDSVQQLMIAMQLADCALGTDCRAGSAAALSLCAGRGWCDGSVSDAVRSARPGDLAALQALARQLAQAIRQRDGAAFVPGV